ncbi:hypothetical protein [Gemmatimonas sp.]|uniref:hypothetical protein n=1 Tax=Gemmatimonas sp. TaxID=1962908 RepID=UPI003F6FB2FF
MTIGMLLGRPGHAIGLTNPLRDAVRSTGTTCFRAGFAFVTVDGVKSVFDPLMEEPAFERLPKQVIVGIGHGITQPAALRKLATVPNCDLRLFIGERQRLTRDALVRAAAFHAKALLVHGGKHDHPRYVMASSANLTGSAVGVAPSNFELGILARLSDSEARHISPQVSEWWRAAEARSVVATPAIIARYAELRLALLAEKPDLIELHPAEATIADATHFWMEIGAASGGSRHQIEFPEALARFFRTPIRDTVNLTLRYQNVERADRTLAHKETTFGVDIWRLSMLTGHQGGPQYQGRIVHFTREALNSFRLCVADPGSAEAARWQRSANDAGHLGRTGGGQSRAYGYY